MKSFGLNARTIGSVMVLAALCCLPLAANADTITFSTAPGAQNGGGNAVDASVTFTTGNGTLTIDLTNLLSAAGTTTVAQNISDLFFTLSNTTSTGSVSSSSATFINVDGSGNGTTTAVGGTDPINWVLTNSGGTYHLNDLDGAAAGPAHTIIGGCNESPSYPNANGSIANNDPHNPFVYCTGHFVLSIPGINSDTTISNVLFSFGTAAGDNVPGNNNNNNRVPEPASLTLLGGGLLTLARIIRRNTSK